MVGAPMASDYEWRAIPEGEYEIGLRENEARTFAEQVAREAREAAAREPDLWRPEREAKRLEEEWGNPEYLYAKLAHSVPAHRVRLPAFSITTTPVSLADFTAFRIATRAAPRETFESPGAPHVPEPDEPVTGISWAEAKALAAWKEAALPHEAEWEAALRPLGRSPFGSIGHELYEWCADEFGPYPGADQRAFGRIAPPPGGWWGTRVRRGGTIPGFPVNVVTRRGADPALRLRDTTFRLVRR